MEKQKIKKLIPLLCCIAILGSMIVPVSAAETSDVFDPIGEWYFDEDFLPPFFTSLSSHLDGDDVDFQSEGVSFCDIVYDPLNKILSYESFTGTLCNVWTESLGWLSDEYRSIYFGTSTFDFPLDVWVWLNNTAVRRSDEYSSYSTCSITIGDDSFSFSGKNTSPDVQISTTSTGCTLTAGYRSKTWTYSGNLSFEGFSLSSDSTIPVYVPGETDTIPGSDAPYITHTLFPIAGLGVDHPASGRTYSLRVNILSNNGHTLFETWQWDGLPGLPTDTFTIAITHFGLKILNDSGSTVYEWYDVDSGYLGMASRRAAASPDYPLYYRFQIGGDSRNENINLYCVYDSGFSDPTAVDLVSWLSTAVGGFLDFQLWPGMSLNQLMWVVLALGVLFWLFKVVT